MDFLPLRAYDNYLEANLTLALLEEANIVCYIKDEYTLTIDPLLNNALGGMKLMVNAIQFARAKDLLELAEARYLQTFTCPVCGEAAIRKESATTNYSSFTDRLKSMLINGTTQKVTTFYRCNNCKHEFRETPSME